MNTDQNTFFITGLPRSRTAWLANFLTYGNSFCFHEASRQVASVEEMASLFASTGCPSAGTADSGFPFYFEKALAQWPEARGVVILREKNDACASFQRLLKENKVKFKASPFLTFEALQQKLDEFLQVLSDRHLLVVDFEELGKERVARSIWEHCVPGEPWNGLRWEMLETMRMSVIPQKIISQVDLARLTKIFNPQSAVRSPQSIASSRPTALQNQYNALLDEMCRPAPGAIFWLQTLWEILLTWDHIQDNDALDKAMANRAFQALMFYWPRNPFFIEHKDKLIPVMINAMSAWGHENGKTGRRENEKAYDAYTEVPCAVAAIIGGLPCVEKFMPRLRALVDQIREEDNR